MQEKLPKPPVNSEILPVFEEAINRRSAIINSAVIGLGWVVFRGGAKTHQPATLTENIPATELTDTWTDSEQLSAISALILEPTRGPQVFPKRRTKPAHISRKHTREITEIKYVPRHDKDGKYIPLAGGCWGELGMGESGNNYTDKDSPKYRGRWQYDQGTWDGNCAFKQWKGKDPGNCSARSTGRYCIKNSIQTRLGPVASPKAQTQSILTFRLPKSVLELQKSAKKHYCPSLDLG